MKRSGAGLSIQIPDDRIVEFQLSRMIKDGYCSYVEAMQFDWDDYWAVYDMMEVSDWVDFELHYHAEQRAKIK